MKSTTLALGALAAAPGESAAQGSGRPAAARPELYELRIYKLRIGAQPKLMNDFLGEVYLPLANKLGAKPVGAFNQTFGPEAPTMFVLTPFQSLASYESFRGKLSDELRTNRSSAAQAFLSGAAAQAPYVRLETQLLSAFDSMPRLEVPTATARKEPRIFELRTYETAGEDAQRKKIEMFGPRMGELAIFRKVGLTPVFFASNLVSTRQPAFTYMLTFPDLAGRDAAWKRFREDPDWLKLKATPGYTDAEIMSNITDLIVTPAPYSQI